MHLLLCLGSVIFAVIWRYVFPVGNLSFLLPPLLLFSTTIVVLLMGYEGQMWMMAAGWSGFVIALVYACFAVFTLLHQVIDLHRSVHKVKQLPLQVYQLQEGQINFRLLDHHLPFAGLVGWLQPQLVLSQGLLDLLDQEHLAAVIYHEEAHRFYEDCFWFFWLGYLKRVTFFLPRSEELWQALLLEREIRADRKAAETIDPLCIAESLVAIITQGNKLTFAEAVAFSPLEQRIEALLSPQNPPLQFPEILFSIFLSLLPLFYLPFHN